MSDEIFGGVVAVNLSLAEAIIRNILPAPEYVAALYTLNEEAEDLLEVLEKSNKSDNEKKEIAAEINKAKVDWEKTSGIPQILTKHMKPGINKFIVFCKDQVHLDEMEAEVQKWFRKAKTHRWRKVFRVLSAEEQAENNRNLSEFKKATRKDTAHLLFAIDMFNEGLHIPDVGAVILLRPTESPTLFYQQIGRCIQVGSEQTPIIFDFVNNFQAIRANDFLDELEEARETEQEKRAELGLDEYTPSIHIHDETKDVMEVFNRISEKLVSWEVMFQKLIEYKARFGDCNVSGAWPENPTLARWVSTQRLAYKRARLDSTKIRRLENIGFSWDPINENWEQTFTDLTRFKAAYGHCNVPQRLSENPTLARWVSSQRQAYKRARLDSTKINRLEDIGLVWDPMNARWEQLYIELTRFKDEHGHCDVTPSLTGNNQLVVWVNTQRYDHSKGKLDETKVKRLEAIGFVWNPINAKWEQMYIELKRFRDAHGHCNVTSSHAGNDALLTWRNSLRHAYSKGKMDESKIKRLEEIGFVWDALSEKWEMMLIELTKFKSKYGNCDVPKRFDENPSLGIWVTRQRYLYGRGKIDTNRIDRLEEIGFVWDPIRENWEQRFKELTRFKSLNGHCNVPKRWQENLKFGSWVQKQRTAYSKGKLDKSKIHRLEEIGFEWNPLDEKWESMFTELKRFRDMHGHCDVPTSFAENPKLGNWVSSQRKVYNDGKLDNDRILRLNEIGFVWKVTGSNKRGKKSSARHRLPPP